MLWSGAAGRRELRRVVIHSPELDAWAVRNANFAISKFWSSWVRDANKEDESPSEDLSSPEFPMPIDPSAIPGNQPALKPRKPKCHSRDASLIKT